MFVINETIQPHDLLSKLEQFFDLAGQKIKLLEKEWDTNQGTPVYTVKGKYTTRGWTEWTQGFQYGCSLLQYDVTEDKSFLELGRRHTVQDMAPHVSHIGVHDHGFNNVSTYGNLLRLMNEGKVDENQNEREFYELALKVSGAIQASRWTSLQDGLGFIHSFNGPQSLFSDTIRSVRALSVAYQLGHVLMGEQDDKISLLERGLQHAETTARYNVYFGENRDAYDLSGRVVHESIFNTKSRSYRCASTQQGYSPFTTWTRGHAWVLSGFPEQLEFLDTLPESEFEGIATEFYGSKEKVINRFLQVSEATADFYISQFPKDGIPYWDTGAPGLAQMGDYLNRDADPFNDYEPVDSSAASISAQGLIRLGIFLNQRGQSEKGSKYLQAGLTVANRLFEEPYLSTDLNHHGLILHSIYHRPNNWDYIPQGSKIPYGESTMWGDYHAMELATLLWRLAKKLPYYKFFL